MGFMDKLKQKADEYDLQGKADKLAQQIEKGTQQAVEKAGEYAHENRDKIATGIDKAVAKFDEQTQGKYSDKVAKAKDLAAKGVDKVAEQRTGAAEGAAGAAGAAGASAYGVSDPTPQDATPQDAVHPPTYGAASPTTPTAPTTGTPGTTPTPSAGATPPPGPADPSI